MHLPRAHFIRKEGGVPSGLNMRKKIDKCNTVQVKQKVHRTSQLCVTKRLFSPEKTCTKPKLVSMHFLNFSAWPGRIHAYSQTFSVSFKSSLLYYLASSSEVQVSAPSIAVLTPPSSLPRWDMYKCTLYSILVHRLAKPQADSPICYAFRLIWLCMQVRISYYLSNTNYYHI